jgi:D-aminopeptidase
MKKIVLLLMVLPGTLAAQAPRFRDTGVRLGVLKTGPLNAITDVSGVRVGHVTLQRGDSVRTGVTAILPHGGNVFQQKVPAAMFVGNGFGKLTGLSQVQELGTLETPIVLTNTLAVPAAARALIDHTLAQPGNNRVRSVNPVVGETNDGFLNDITGPHVRPEHVRDALRNATAGPVPEGNVGAGTGTVAFGWKGGIGTSSRVVPRRLGGYTVGVLVQTNYGGVFEMAGVPVGVELGRYFLSDQLNDPGDGSCMIVVATDAPLTARNLERLARRAWSALARTGGIATNGSGEYVIAFSTAEGLRVPSDAPGRLQAGEELINDALSPLFLAVIEATEEAVYNSLWAARTLKGARGTVEALPQERVREVLKKYGRIR